MNSRRYQIISTVQGVLRYHQQCGIHRYFRNEDIDRFMLKEQHSSRRPVKEHDVVCQPESDQATDVSLSEVHNDISVCSSCDLAARKQRPSTGRGGEGARLLIVGQWLSVGSNQTAGEVVFGSEEDLMLDRMIAALKLEKESTFVTNLVKCALDGATLPPVKENYLSCLPFLQRQIRQIRPAVICVMGATAAQVILKSNRSLSQLRGRFYPYQAGSGKPIPLMATYHPTFLLKNEEMKKVAWVDLQAIGRRLQELS